MTYDNTDTNADGEIDAPVNNESVSTEDQTITQSVTYPDGSSTTDSPIEFDEEDTISVGTTATEIYNLTADSRSGMLLLVGGVKQGTDDNVFHDVIFHGYRYGGGPAVIASKSASADPRTYSKGSLNSSLELAMDANTYDVGVKAVGVMAP